MFKWSPCACVGTLWVLPESKDMCVRIADGSELTTAVNASVNDSLCLCVSPMKDWQPVQCFTHTLPHDSLNQMLKCNGQYRAFIVL